MIPPGRTRAAIRGVIGADRLGLILTALRDTYDFVIVAAPVLGAAQGAFKLARLSPYVVCIEEPSDGESSVEGLCGPGVPRLRARAHGARCAPARSGGAGPSAGRGPDLERCVNFAKTQRLRQNP